MQWNKYVIRTTPIGVELIIGALIAHNIVSVEELPDDSICFYLEHDNPILLDELKQEIEELREYGDIGSGEIRSSVTNEEDWINNWKAFFKPVVIEGVLIWPSWETGPKDMNYETCIEIDPGTTFGGGGHETTQLCISALKKVLKDDTREVLDVGCGSGILSILCLKYGASHVTGIDIDEQCRNISRTNMALNHINEDKATWLIGNLLDENENSDRLIREIRKNQYEIIVANMLADITIPMLPLLHEVMQPGGTFITSGVIDFKEEPMKKALTVAGFTIIDTHTQGEWVSITARRA